jgi:predicted transcriptional regulator
MSKKATGVLLTEVELELMSLLWRLGSGTVREILELREELGGKNTRPMAYTSASTIIRILEQKGIVKSEKWGKSHIYSPILKKADYEKKTLHHVVDTVFDANPSSLVKRLLGTAKLSDDEKQELKKLIKEL